MSDDPNICECGFWKPSTADYCQKCAGNRRTSGLILFLSLALAALLSGCITAPDSSILAVKDTVLGIDIGSSNPQTYHMRLGLVRRHYQRIPTSTNGVVFSPDYSSAADGGVGLTRQNAKEEYRVGKHVFREDLPGLNR